MLKPVVEISNSFGNLASDEASVKFPCFHPLGLNVLTKHGKQAVNSFEGNGGSEKPNSKEYGAKAAVDHCVCGIDSVDVCERRRSNAALANSSKWVQSVCCTERSCSCVKLRA